jgi:hypothetical protein
VVEEAPVPAAVSAAGTTPAGTSSPFVSTSALLESMTARQPERGSEPGPAAAPAPGFGGLAVSPSAPRSDTPGTTAGGLVRRVPGAQHPVTEIGGPGHGENGSSGADEPTPDSVSSFLSDFSAGVARGIDDAGHNPWDDDRR